MSDAQEFRAVAERWAVLYADGADGEVYCFHVHREEAKRCAEATHRKIDHPRGGACRGAWSLDKTWRTGLPGRIEYDRFVCSCRYDEHVWSVVSVPYHTVVSSAPPPTAGGLFYDVLRYVAEAKR